MRRYGISTVSMFPWSSGPGAINRSLRMSTASGADGIQVLPLRGWNFNHTTDWERYVISYEDAWNHGPLWKVFLRQLGVMGDPAPRFLDWVLFGRKDVPDIPNALRCSHHVEYSDGAVTEVHPELWPDPKDWIDFCRLGGQICWDTWHVRRPHRETGKTLGDWKYLLSQLPDDCIRLIHVHPTRAELSQFLSITSGDMELSQMLSVLREKGGNSPAVIEVFPPSLSMVGSIQFLSRLISTTKRWLG